MRNTRSKKHGFKRELESETEGSQEELSQNKKQKISPERAFEIPTIIPLKVCLFSNQLLTHPTQIAENSTLASILWLPHPKTGNPTPFVLTEDTNILCEIKNFDKPYKTILTHDRIISKPSIYLITPFDPIFTLLFLLETQDSEHFCLLEQLLFNTEFKDLPKISSNLTQKVVELICDTRLHENQLACKYNKGQTMITLEAKVRKVAGKLPNLNSFQSSYKSMVSTENGALKYAVSLVSEYLRTDLVEELAVHLGLTDYNRIIAECEQDVRRMEVATAGEGETKKETKKVGPQKKQSRAKKLLEKTDKTGMKSISTFFTKPADK